MRAGTAWQDITPSEPIHILGQMHKRLGEFTHDPLTVNAVVFDDGAQRVALVSCDLCMLPDDAAAQARAACAEKWGMADAAVLIACTHTHLTPCTIGCLAGDVVPAFMARLQEAIVASVGAAIDDLADVELYAGEGWIDQMGFNRRGMSTDGRTNMYHGAWNEDFAGVEGPRDGAVPVILARRADGSPKVVIPSFATHPNSVEGESYYSADLVGAVRQVLRAALGDDVGVVYLTGAGGNTAPSILADNKENVQPWRGEQGWRRSGLYLGGEILKVIAATWQPMAKPELRLAGAVEPIDIRPWPEDLDPATMRAGGPHEYYVRSRKDWPRMLAEESPTDVRLNALRIGDAVICTNPAEFYVEHGLAIKKASPARVTVVSQLTDGYCGYVPTGAAFARGGYSTWAAPTSKLRPEAGDIMVATTTGLLKEVFAE